MTYEVKITTQKDINELKKIFTSEDKIFPNGRAEYNTDIQKDSLLISAKAQDQSSLRAVLNSITTVLEIYEKSERITE